MDDQEKEYQIRQYKLRLWGVFVDVGSLILGGIIVAITNQPWNLATISLIYLTASYFLAIKKYPNVKIGIILIISSLFFVSFVRFEIKNDLIIYDFDKKIFRKINPPITFINPLNQRTIRMVKGNKIVIDNRDYHYYLKFTTTESDYEVGYYVEINYENKNQILEYIRKKHKRSFRPIDCATEFELTIDGYVRELPEHFDKNIFQAQQDVKDKIEIFLHNNAIDAQVYFKIETIQKHWPKRL